MQRRKLVKEGVVFGAVQKYFTENNSAADPQAIANMAGLNYNTVLRYLGSLRRRGIIIREKKRIGKRNIYHYQPFEAFAEY